MMLRLLPRRQQSLQVSFLAENAPRFPQVLKELLYSNPTVIKSVVTPQFSAFPVAQCASGSTIEKTSSTNGSSVGIRTCCVSCQGSCHSCCCSRCHFQIRTFPLLLRS